jgi:uncharacterized membrane protein (DUF4010 family)
MEFAPDRAYHRRMPSTWFTGDAERDLWSLATALVVGLVIGAERERRKGDGPARSAAGIRTFAAVAALGGVASLLGVPVVAVGALFVGGAAIASYLAGDRSDPGLTTEISLVLCYALGALAPGRPAVALAAAIGTAALLAARGELHHFLHDTLSEQELRDGLVLGLAALVILPLMPDRFMGPYAVLNPHTLWRLAVVMMALTAAGYVAQRAVGSSMGLAIAGLAGGFVSSAATIAAMGSRTREHPTVHAGAVAGASASTVATFVQLALLVTLADPSVARLLAWPLACGGAAAAAWSALYAWRAAHATGPAAERGRAFKVLPALLFAGLVGAVGLLAALAESRFGQAAVPVTAALAGFADAHASSASAAGLAAAGRVPGKVAVLAVLLALTTNTITKAVLAFTTGGRRYGWQVTMGLILCLAGAWGALLVVRGA